MSGFYRPSRNRMAFRLLRLLPSSRQTSSSFRTRSPLLTAWRKENHDADMTAIGRVLYRGEMLIILTNTWSIIVLLYEIKRLTQGTIYYIRRIQEHYSSRTVLSSGNNTAIEQKFSFGILYSVLKGGTNWQTEHPHLSITSSEAKHVTRGFCYAIVDYERNFVKSPVVYRSRKPLLLIL